MPSFWTLCAEAGMTSRTVALSVTSPWGPSSELRLQPQGARPVHTRGPRRPSVGTLDSAHEPPTNTTAAEGDRHSIRPLKNISVRLSGENTAFCDLEKSLHFAVPLSHTGSIIFLASCRQKCFYKHYQGYVRSIFPYYYTVTINSPLALHDICSWKPRILHFKIQLEPYELGINLLQNLGTGIRHKC